MLPMMMADQRLLNVLRSLIVHLLEDPAGVCTTAGR